MGIVETERGIRLTSQKIGVRLTIPNTLLTAPNEEERWMNSLKIAKRIFKAAFSARGYDIETRIMILAGELESYFLYRNIAVDLWDAIGALWSNAIDHKLVAEFLEAKTKREAAAAFLDYAPQILKELKEDGDWAEDDECCIDERVHDIAELVRTAAEDLADRAEDEGKYDLVEIGGKFYPAYKGPTKVIARVERDEYITILAKYGNRTAKVIMEGEHRQALLANLAAAATRDVYSKKGIFHTTSSPLQAADRLLAWAPFMPGDYPLVISHVYLSRRGLRPRIKAAGAITPVHAIAFKLAKSLLGGVDAVRISAAAWLLAADVLATPEGKRPSSGLPVLAARMAVASVAPAAVQTAAMKRSRKKAARAFEEAMRRAQETIQELERNFKRALAPLKPYVEELDRLLGVISAEDKRLLLGKLARYDEGLSARRTVGKATFELNGVMIHMADVFGAAALTSLPRH